ncbi:hypothetical protein ACIG0D_29150 [Streptomyces sp. NPDC052773]|uniref:hypothetical protein n=1 Tax=Streptomyces sp. NPDC052773 TaxID=3365693 RepID=UPI0037D13891
MTTYGLGPTKLYAPSERLLHGKGVESAIGAGEAGDWIRLDSGVHWATRSNVFRGWKSTSWIRVGFRSVNAREIADWRQAPYWQEGLGGTGVPSWSLPPTESEIALCLCHGDPRVRAAALALDESAELPASVLPLVLIRSADTDVHVRTLARAILDRVLGDADKALLRRLASLAALVGRRRRYGTWAREAVLGRLGALPDDALPPFADDPDPRRPRHRPQRVSAAPPASCGTCSTARGRTCRRGWRSSWNSTGSTGRTPAAAARLRPRRRDGHDRRSSCPSPGSPP